MQTALIMVQVVISVLLALAILTQQRGSGLSATFGGGGGFYTRRLLANGYRVTCVDLSDEALLVNRSNAQEIGKEKELETVVADFVGFCREDKRQFDQVLFLKVLHHFDRLDSIKEALRGAIRHCRSGGRVIIFEPNGDNPFWWFFLSLMKDKSSGRSKWFYEKNMKFTTVAQLSRILDQLRGELGSEFKYRVGYHYVVPSVILNKRHWMVSVLRKANRMLEATWLRNWFAFNISVVIDVDPGREVGQEDS